MIRITLLDLSDPDTAGRAACIIKSAAQAEAHFVAGLCVASEPPRACRPDETLLGADVGGSLLGIARFRAVGPIELRAVAVDPRHHRNGIGLALVRAVVRRVMPASVIVTTAASNTPALALYARTGFQEFSRSIAPHFGVELVHLFRSARS